MSGEEGPGARAPHGCFTVGVPGSSARLCMETVGSADIWGHPAEGPGEAGCYEGLAKLLFEGVLESDSLHFRGLRSSNSAPPRKRVGFVPELLRVVSQGQNESNFSSIPGVGM